MRGLMELVVLKSALALAARRLHSGRDICVFHSFSRADIQIIIYVRWNSPGTCNRSPIRIPDRRDGSNVAFAPGGSKFGD
jgi:hypothetical protein